MATQTRTRRAKVEEQVEAQAPVQEEQVTYNLEPLTEEAVSQLRVWDNFTVNTTARLVNTHPQWAAMLNDMLEVVRMTMNVQS